jgi:lysozyme
MRDIKEMLKVHEGYRRRPYRCTKGKWTIGVGWNLNAHRPPEDIVAYLQENGYITDEMIERLLDISLAAAIKDCQDAFPEFGSYTDGRKCALIDMTFHMGEGIWNGETADLIRSGKWSQAADRIKTHWLYAKQTPGRCQENVSLLKEG